MDTSRYLDLFVQEAKEHLEALGNDLLVIEREDRPETLDSAFRHAHSIKGMAASMGYSPIANLAHNLEDLLDLARGTKERIDSDGIDAALAVTDGLVTLVEVAAKKLPLDSAGVQVEELMNRIGAATKAMRDEKASPSPAARAALPSANLASRGKEQDKPDEKAQKASSRRTTSSSRSHLKISVQVEGTSKIPAVRAFLVHKRLSDLGEIISSDPSLSDLRAGQLPEGRLEIVLATDVGEEAVSRELRTISELSAVEVETVAVTPSRTEEASYLPRASSSAVRANEPIRTVRIRTDLLDGFMDGVGELLLVTDRLRQVVSKEESDSISPLAEAVDRASRIARSLHHKVMATRMTPLSTITDRLPRVARETLRRLDKEAILEIEGAEIELDRAILDEIETPLGHLVRNCIDHGIETRARRREHGKSVVGKVRLEASRDRHLVVIEVSDDGRGLDTEALKARAAEVGLLDDEAAASLSYQEALMLPFQPGLSTASSITEISGRGVGLDVVKDTVETLGGSIEVKSAPGESTTFRLLLPLTIAIQRLLLVSVAEEIFAIPVNKVLQVQQIERMHYVKDEERVQIPFMDDEVPVYSLPRILDLESNSEKSELASLVVVENTPGSILALAVDGLSGQVEGIVRPLGRPLDLLGCFSGVSMLPDGRPILVLDLSSLVRVANSLDTSTYVAAKGRSAS